MDTRELSLPKWAQEIIKDLRRQMQASNEPLRKELAVLRPKVAELKAKNDALVELLTAAARGGHLTANNIIDVIQEYAPWKE